MSSYNENISKTNILSSAISASNQCPHTVNFAEVRQAAHCTPHTAHRAVISHTAYHFVSPLLTGLLIVFAAPPFDLWPLAFVCLIPIYLALKDAPPLQAFGIGWLAGFLMLVFGCTWWVGLLESFAKLSALESIGMMVLFCGYQALVYGIWAGVCSFLWKRFQMSWLVTGPLVIVVCEALFPFFFKMYLAIMVWQAWPFTQGAEIGGPAAVSGLIVLANIVLAEMLLTVMEKRRIGRAVIVGAIVFLAITATGFSRAMYVDSCRKDAPSMRVGIVQPNFGVVTAEERKMDGVRYIRALRNASVAAAKHDVDLTVWPETAWPYPMDRKMAHDYPKGHPWELKKKIGGRLLFGTLTNSTAEEEVHNSAVLVSESGEIAGRYDKNRLLPFGEYIPFEKEFPKKAEELRENMPHWPEITPGDTGRVLSDQDLRAGVLICSEDIKKYDSEKDNVKPNLLVSLVSNAWFGATAAPAQHLALASFRAIEMRRDFVRATNTGVSAIVDAAGRVMQHGPLLDVRQDEPEPATVITGNVSLLEIGTVGKMVRRFFSFVVLGVLIFWCTAHCMRPVPPRRDLR